MIVILTALIVVNVLVMATHRAPTDGSRGGTGERALGKDTGTGTSIDGSDETPEVHEDFEDSVREDGAKG